MVCLLTQVLKYDSYVTIGPLTFALTVRTCSRPRTRARRRVCTQRARTKRTFCVDSIARHGQQAPNVARWHRLEGLESHEGAAATALPATSAPTMPGLSGLVR